MNVLNEIIAQTTADVYSRKNSRPLAAVVEAAEAATTERPAADVYRRLRGGAASEEPDQQGLRVISEVKRSSPSAGALATISDPAALASAYAAAGAAMISVLTEPHWFNGSLADLRSIRAAVETPLLRKDFIVDEYQIAEARAAGADCVLLIVAALDDRALADLLACSRSWGMEPLVEVHDQPQLERAVAAGATIIGVNARDLTSLKVLPGLFAQLAPGIPPHCVAVAESGIHEVADARAVADSGADAILVGQALVQAADPAQLISDFRRIERRRS